MGNAGMSGMKYEIAINGEVTTRTNNFPDALIAWARATQLVLVMPDTESLLEKIPKDKNVVEIRLLEENFFIRMSNEYGKLQETAH